jgi:hypothetical protein
LHTPSIGGWLQQLAEAKLLFAFRCGKTTGSDVMERRRFLVTLLIAEFAIVIVGFVILRSDPDFFRWLFS